MKFIDKLKKKGTDSLHQSKKPSKDLVQELATFIDDKGKVDFKKVSSKHVTEAIKKVRSLDEQNKYLSKYLKEMVKENENLQSDLHDSKMTLAQAKQSLADLTTEMRALAQMNSNPGSQRVDNF